MFILNAILNKLNIAGKVHNNKDFTRASKKILKNRFVI